MRLGPTILAPPPTVPSSASWVVYGMSAPRPTKSGSVLVLLARLTGSSLASSAMTVFTVYLPLAAVQVPRRTGAVVAPGSMAPLCAPVRVLTTAPLASVTVRVIGWAPEAEAVVPWFFTATEKASVSPAEAEEGDQETGEATRSELATGLTTSGSGLVYRLLASSCSVTLPLSSTTAPTSYDPASREPTEPVTVREAPAASAGTSAVPAFSPPRRKARSVAAAASVPELVTVAVRSIRSDSTGSAGVWVILVTSRSGLGAGTPCTSNSASWPAGAPELAVNFSCTSAKRPSTGMVTVFCEDGAKV